MLVDQSKMLAYVVLCFHICILFLCLFVALILFEALIKRVRVYPQKKLNLQRTSITELKYRYPVIKEILLCLLLTYVVYDI